MKFQFPIPKIRTPLLMKAKTRGYFSNPKRFSEQKVCETPHQQKRFYDDLVSPPAIKRQLYRMGSLRLPGHHVTATVFRTAIKETSCI